MVTGALGHIGSSLIRTLPAQFPGTEIVLIDNLSTQRYPSLFNLPAAGRYRFVELDVRSADLRSFFDAAHVAVHLAAKTDAAGSVNDAAAVESNNYQATEKVAAACIETGTSMIHLSSTSVYGTQAATVSEDCSADELRAAKPLCRDKA